jgi:nucleoside-diphosphate-sugar epimerase
MLRGPVLLHDRALMRVPACHVRLPEKCRRLYHTLMNILVTGAAGYIGSIVCERLLETGLRITALDRSPGNLGHLCHDELFSFVRADVRDGVAMNGPVSRADAIIHLAAIVGETACKRDRHAAMSTNIEAAQLLDGMRSKNQLLIFPNTNSGYGTTSGDVPCTEETPLAPISLYGRTKRQAEKTLLSSDKGNAISLRLATVFGMSPKMRWDLLVNHFVRAACENGYLVIFEKDFKRNFVHVRDVADCVLFCIRHPEMAGKAYNLGQDSANLSKEELALKIREHVPNFYVHFAPIGEDPDKRNYVVSSARLHEAGFKAEWTLDDGIRELIKGYEMEKT